MPSLLKISIFLYLFVTVTGQWGLPKFPALPTFPELPKLPGLPKLPELRQLPNPSELPTPETFLEMLLNVTTGELLDVVANFAFDEILSEHIQFLLYNKNSSITLLDTHSKKYHVTNTSDPIKIIIHGWQSKGDHDAVKDMVKSYHDIEIYNVFSVDWSSHAKHNYLQSARGTKKVGEIVGEFIMNLINNNKKLLRNVHLIGHSLGAQISGFAGKHVKNLTNGQKIGRITGLDAAAPLFEFPIKMPNHLRLVNEDADFVDGIHTNIGFFGFLAPFGDADYYVGFGGPIQSGCMNINVFEAFVCSHVKSHDIYIKTITSTDYVATSCGNPLRAITGMCENNAKVVMGEHATRNARGDYFINIDSKNMPERKRSIRDVISKILTFNKKA